MKFKASCENVAKFRRKQIRTRLYESGFITLYEVKEMFMEKTNESDQDYGWPKVVALENKIRVRRTKKGWFLYLPEPSKMTCNGENMNINTVDQLENGFKIKYSNPVDKVVEMFEENNKKTDTYMEKEIEAIDNIRLSIDGMVDRIIERWIHYDVDVFTGFEKLGEVIGGHYGYFYRPCIVKAKKSGRKEERQDRNAKFHRWADLSKGVQQVVALVEFEDGHVEQVQPDRVIFKEEKR